MTPTVRSGSIRFLFLTLALNMIATESQAQIYYEEAVAPILRKNCVACHNAKLAEGGLNLESIQTITKGGDSGIAVDKNAVDKSLIVERVISSDPDSVMPPKGNTVGASPLTADQIKTIKEWIAGGMLSKGSSSSIPNMAAFHLPESAKASYALAVSPMSDFVAFGRGGKLVIHNAQRLSTQLELDASLEAAPYQVIDAHPDFIHSITFSNDGQRLATGSTGQVKIWKCTHDTAESLRTELEQAAIPLSHLFCTSSDASMFAILRKRKLQNNESNPAQSGVITILNRQGEIVNSFDVVDPNLACATWSPSNQIFFAVGTNRILYSWNLTDMGKSGQTSIALPYDVRALIAIDESTLLILTDKKTEIWRLKDPTHADLDSEHALSKALQSSGPIDFVAITPNRTKLATGTQDEAGKTTTLKLWSIAQAKQIGTWQRDQRLNLARLMSDRIFHRANSALERSKGSVTELEKALQAEENAVKNAQTNKEKTAEAFTKKEQELAAAAKAMADHEKSIADAQAAVEAAMKKLETLKTELEPKKKMVADLEKQKMDAQTAMENAVQSLAASEESQKSAQARLEEKKQVVVHQTEELSKVKTQNDSAKLQAESAKFFVSEIAFVDNHTLAAIAAQSGEMNETTIELYSADTLERTDSQSVNHKIKTCASLAALLSPSIANRKWQLEHQWESPRFIMDRVTALAFSPDDSKLAIGSGIPSRNGQLAVVEIANGKPLKSDIADPENDAMNLHSDTILGLAYSPDGKWMASCGADKMIKIIDAQTYKVVKTFEGHTHHVLSLAWQDTAHRIATASADATVKIWDVEKGEAIRTITGFGTEVTAIAFVGITPNVATSTMNNLVRIYDADSGKQAKQFSPASDALYSIAVTPNGKYTLAAGQEGIVRIWKNEDGKLISEWK